MFLILAKFILDCAALKKSGLSSSGVYSIDPDGKGSMNVSCDMVTDGEGWTVIQRRVDNSTNFYLDWNSYKQGFGSLTGNFWLGNDNIHRLTASGNTVLRVDLEDWDGQTAYAMIGTFVVDNERNKYKLSATNYNQSSTAGFGLFVEDRLFFSTKDRNNFPFLGTNFALQYKGGWWYSNNPGSNLNGRYLGNRKDEQGMFWKPWRRRHLSLKRSEMKIRPSSLN